MIRRDYILRQIEQLVVVLAKILTSRLASALALPKAAKHTTTVSPRRLTLYKLSAKM
jgi:hypothetical protein